MPTYILWVYTGNINNGRILWSLILAFFLIKCLGKGSHSDQAWRNTRIFTPGGPNLQYPFFHMVPMHHWCIMSSIGFTGWKFMFLRTPPNTAARSQNSKGKRPQQCQLTFCGCILGVLTMVESHDLSFWHFAWLNVWTKGLTVTKPGGTLGFSHLGTPTYNIHFFTWFLCTIGV